MLVEQPVLVVFGEVPALVAQLAQAVVLLEGQRMDPGQVEPDLQIAQVALAEAAQGFAARCSGPRPRRWYSSA